MINLKNEKSYKFSTQDVYDIVDYAMDAADDSGFINSFIFERALYEFAALIAYPEEKEKYSNLIAENINVAWDKMLEDGIFDKLSSEFERELEHVAHVAARWSEDYSAYAHSMRGVLDEFQTVAGNAAMESISTLNKIATNDVMNNVNEIADKWGLNNAPSLFESAAK